MSGASERAVEAALTAAWGSRADRLLEYSGHVEGTRNALTAAHDPALGLDRSVCLRDVVEALREFSQSDAGVHQCASFIECEFGGER